jgi:hypothetical protein
MWLRSKTDETGAHWLVTAASSTANTLTPREAIAGRKWKTEDRSSATRGLKKLRAKQGDGDRRPKSQVRGTATKSTQKPIRPAENRRRKNERDQIKLLGAVKSKSSDKNRMLVKCLGHFCCGACEKIKNQTSGKWRLDPDLRMQDENLITGAEARKQEWKKQPKADRGNGI